MPEMKPEIIEHDNNGSIITEYVTKTYDGTTLISKVSLFGLNGKLDGYFGRFHTLEAAKEADNKRIEMAG